MKIYDKSVRFALPRTFVIALLLSFYILAFIITPYWIQTPLPEASFFIVSITVAAGAIWGFLSGSNVRVQFSIKNLLFFIILLAGIVILNFKQLRIGIPWRGDEDYHFGKALVLTLIINNNWLLGGLIAFAIFLFIAWVKPQWIVPAFGLIVGGSILYTLLVNPYKGLEPGFFLRYPFVSYWFAAIAPKIASFFTEPFHEILYRIIPILFTSAIAWLFQRSLTTGGLLTRIFWAIAVATMPLAFYYSSILYLEMPAVFLMLVVCYRIKSLLYEDAAQLKQNPGWYALILIGFIKETTVLFLFGFLVCRWVVRFLRRIRGNPFRIGFRGIIENLQTAPFARALIEEIGIAFAILFPTLLYILLRSNLTTTRSFVPNLNFLLEPRVYSAIGRSFIDQFGLFLILFCAGSILLLLQKEYAVAGFFLLTLLGTLLFYTLDNWTFVGYSRFNLFILPFILAGSSVILNRIPERKKFVGLGLACATVLVGVFLSPINIDGTKKPLWDNYNSDMAEHYYPYREAMYWIKHAFPEKSVLFAGINYSYYFNFYYQKYHWLPKYELFSSENAPDDSVAVVDSLSEAEKGDYEIVVYQVRGKNIPQVEDTGSFRQIKVFQNMAHILVLYNRIEP